MAIQLKAVEKGEPGVSGGGAKKYHAYAVSRAVTDPHTGARLSADKGRFATRAI